VKNYPHQEYQTSCSAMMYHYHPIKSDGRERVHRLIEEEDGRTFIDWLFLHPFRCKHMAGKQVSNNSNCIAAIFSMAGMPSAAELFCGSMDGALALERVLANAVGIVKDDTAIKFAVGELEMKKHLSEVSFQTGYVPIIRYTNGDEWIPSASLSVGMVSNEAFNTVKRICGFSECGGARKDMNIFTKQEMACPIGNTRHHVELRSTPGKEEIIFRLGRRRADIESQTIMEDACHRFLATGMDSSFLFLIVGPRASGKTSALREFRKTLSISSGFHKWNIIDGNEIANYISIESTQTLSSCALSYAKEVSSNNNDKEKKNAILFDDLSLKRGVPMAQHIAEYGTSVIATVGNGSADKCDLRYLTNYLACSGDSVKSVLLEIIPEHRSILCDRSQCSGNASSLKRKSRGSNSKYKVINISNRLGKRTNKRQKLPKQSS